MITEILMTEESLQNVIEACCEYILEEMDEEFALEYQAELDKVDDWCDIIQTGIFHDAIGEVVKVEGMSLYVEDDY